LQVGLPTASKSPLFPPTALFICSEHVFHFFFISVLCFCNFSPSLLYYYCGVVKWCKIYENGELPLNFSFSALENRNWISELFLSFFFPISVGLLLEPVLFACVVTYNFVVGCNILKVLVDLFQIALSLGFRTIWTVLSKRGFCFILRII
jgi:hypothetical protein